MRSLPPLLRAALALQPAIAQQPAPSTPRTILAIGAHAGDMEFDVEAYGKRRILDGAP